MTQDEDLLTVAEAAALVGRSPATIRSWQHRGMLTAAGTTPSRQGFPANTYRRADVLAALAATGGKGARRPPSRSVGDQPWDPAARLLTQAEAAASAGVDDRTVRDWVARGYLAPHPTSAGSGPLYLESQVLDAERSARRADRRYRAKG